MEVDRSMIEPKEIKEIVKRGESSLIQFKERFPNHESVAQELVAFSNSRGGKIIFGVNDKTGELNGLSFEEIRKLNQDIVNVASQHVNPPIFIETETVSVDDHSLVVITVLEGRNKPYKDNKGAIFLKNGSDKRRVVSNDELARLFQSVGSLHADEMEIHGVGIEEISTSKFGKFIERKYNQSLEELGLPIEKLFQNLLLLKNENLTLAGLLLFSDNRHRYRPLFTIHCIATSEDNLYGNTYDDQEPPIEGTIEDVYKGTISFIVRNLRKVQTGESFNSPSELEIPRQVFEELIVNALIHRDYFINSTVKVKMFPDRIEIESPGVLPNSLTVENVKNGISMVKNPTLHSNAQYILPYKGVGTGIPRVISIYPHIDFINDTENNRFIAKIYRRAT